MKNPNVQEVEHEIRQAVAKAMSEISPEIMTKKQLWLAFSGGIDSSVLLKAVCDLGVRPNLIHINHALSINASHWADHAIATGAAYGLRVVVRTLESQPKLGDSLEAWARECRYEIFRELLSEGGVLLLGHHLDDQAETLLLQLLRGAGPKGLASMANQRMLGNGCLFRPLLSISREKIEIYARECAGKEDNADFKWVTDESNENLKFKRNVIRHEVLPILKKHFPGCLSTLERTSRLCADESELLAELVNAELLELVDLGDLSHLGHLSDLKEPSLNDLEKSACSRFYFKREGFQKVSPKMRRQLLRAWLQQSLGQGLNERHLGEIEKLLDAEHWSQSKFEVDILVDGRTSRALLTREKLCLVLNLLF